MPVDGLGSDAGRQSLTAVGAKAVRDRRGSRCAMCGAPSVPGTTRCAACGAFFAATTRGAAAPDRLAVGDANAAVGPRSDPYPVPPMIPFLSPFAAPSATSIPGERLVALSALGVLAIATVFFIERLDILSGAREAPALASPSASSPASTELRVAEGVTGSRDVSLPDPNVTAATEATPVTQPARSRPSVATVRKPEGKAEARSRFAGSIPSSAALSVAGAPPAQPYVRTRWDRLREEIGWCAQQASFFDAALCEQRARQRWCEDWWGRAGECPSGRQADYAN